MRRFNLIDENWIPVRFADGTRSELGIRDTLLRSRQIAVIEDPSPLVVAALHRFLLALLYRALQGPTDIEQANNLFRKGLPGEEITAYLQTWRNRFWLFDNSYPFFQISDYEPSEKKGRKQWRSWSAMTAEHNADNAKVLFDHLDVTTPGAITPSQATRWLIACQTFALGGGNSDFRYTKSGPSATAAMVVPLGNHLSDTLILSLVPENREILQEDIPVWEREPDSLESLQRGVARTVSGFADLYSWRTRSIKLNLDSEKALVIGLAFASGVGCTSEGFVDPMLAYSMDEKKGKLPIQFRDRGLWRDFDSLLPDASRLAPLVIDHVADLTRKNRERFPKAMAVLGQANDREKVRYWRMEYFSLPEALASNRSIRSEIRQLLIVAEDAQKSLWRSCRSFAKDLLSRGGREPAGKDITAFVDQIPASSHYWSTLETCFHDMLGDYTVERDPDDIRYQWLRYVRDTLKDAWELHRTSVSMADAWTIRALAKAEGAVLRKLKELSDEILKYEPVKEDA